MIDNGAASTYELWTLEGVILRTAGVKITTRHLVLALLASIILGAAPAVRADGPAGTGADCPWDLDGSGTVEVTDFLTLLEVWGTDPGGPPDFDGGGVGVTDFLALLAHWGPCPGSFDALTTLTHGPASVVQEFWSQGTRNVLCLGDSIMANSSPARLYDAILRAWDVPAGWRGFHASTGGGAGVQYWNGFGGGYDNVDAFRSVLFVTNASFGGAHFYGLPHQHLNHDVGIGFVNNVEPERRIERASLRPQGFDIGVVDEWFTGNPITMQLMYLYHSEPAPGERYVADVDVGLGLGVGVPDGGPWSYATDFVPAHGLSDIAAGGAGLNLMNRQHPIPTDAGPESMRMVLRSTDDWEQPQQLWCVHLGVKVGGGPGGVFAAVLAESSWQSASWGVDAPASATHKQFTNDELDRYFDLMFDDKDSPVYVVVMEGSEGNALDDYIAHNHDRNDRIRAAWQRVGGGEVMFIYIGTWRTGDDEAARTQNAAFYHTADQRDDTFYVNLYGLLGGILWNATDTGGNQIAFAESRGWDAIAINGGTLDMSVRNALDIWGVHPIDAEAAFFFAWIAAEKIREASGH
jgi:hypothetical protein